MAHAPRCPRAERRPLVLGHRGASADAPENTLAAFRLACDTGADGIELDVWRCRTGEVVVTHDEDTGRVAGRSLRVPDSALAELRALDVGGWKGERWRGERVPLLDEVLDAFPGAVVNVELKSRLDRDLRLAGAVARLLARRRDGDRIIVSSFDYRLLVAFRLAAPGVPVGLLFDGGHRWWLRTALAIRLLHPAAVHPDRRLATADRLRSWAEHGLGVNVWTVDAPEEVERLCGLGATAVISNAPGAAREVVRRVTGR